jgi:hypothetical protein
MQSRLPDRASSICYGARALPRRTPRYCVKIIEHFAAVANVEGNVEDMVTIVRGFGTRADTQWLAGKRGADKARNLIEQSTALWALDSNVRQHEFIRVAVAGYVSQHPEEPASKALIALVQAYGHYDIGKVAALTQPAPGKHSASVNLEYLSEVLDDLGRHAAMYPPHFEFPEDRQPAERDVSAISALMRRSTAPKEAVRQFASALLWISLS